MCDAKKIRELMLLSESKVWGITSFKEGVGKSFFSTSLVNAFEKIGKKVLCISFDEKENAYMPGNIDDVIIFLKNKNDKNIISISNTEIGETIILDDRFKDFMVLCKENFDYVIVDTKSIDSCCFSKALCKMCDENIIIIQKNWEDGIACKKQMQQLKELEIKVFGVVLNEYSTKKSLLKM